MAERLAELGKVCHPFNIMGDSIYMLNKTNKF